MNCKEVQRFLPPYLDGEFEGQERVSMVAHLEICESCRRVARFEEAFRQKIKDSAEKVEAPPWLAAKVQTALKEVDRPHQRLLNRWVRLAVPAAVCILIGTGILLFRDRSSSETYMAEQSVTWHRQNLPLDVTGSNPDAVRAFFSDKVNFAVDPLRFNQPRAKLVGARLSNLRQHQAAYLRYMVNGRKVSVFVLDPNVLPGEGINSPKIHWHKLRGYNVAMFVSNGKGYAMASDMEPKKMIQLISSSR